MWSKRPHLLQPLTALTSKKIKFKWTCVDQKYFDEIELIVPRDTLLIYPNFNKRFDIHTYASEFHTGSVIIKYGKPIAFYIQKPTGPQQRYTVTEKSLLSIVETLKGFCTILLGQQLKIYTDQKYITCKKINTDRLLG